MESSRNSMNSASEDRSTSCGCAPCSSRARLAGIVVAEPQITGPSGRRRQCRSSWPADHGEGPVAPGEPTLCGAIAVDGGGRRPAGRVICSQPVLIGDS